MKKVAMLAVVALLGFALTGCGSSVDSQERVVDDMMGAIRDLNAEMSQIETAEDLKAAEDRLVRIGERMKAIEKRGEELGMDDLSPEEEEALDQRFQEEFEEEASELMRHMFRLAGLAATDPEAAKVLESLDGIME